MLKSEKAYREWLLEQCLKLEVDEDWSIASEFDLIEVLPGLAPIRERLKKHANGRAVKLFPGPPGTGKTTIAEYLHGLGKRRDHPFIRVPCAAIPSELFEQYHFGRERGSHTGASYWLRGYFGEADRGTIFLDEVPEYTPHQQAKLLDVIEYGRYRRVGGASDLTCDVQVVCATNQDLRQLVQKGLVRQDFYQRICDVVIEIPPLCDRREDIPYYLRYFLTQFSQDEEKLRPKVEPKALAGLLFCEWTGNVRSLMQVVRKAVFECQGIITAELISRLLDEVHEPKMERFDFVTERKNWELKTLIWAIRLAGGNDEVAAGMLGFDSKRSVTSLKERLGITNADVLG